MTYTIQEMIAFWQVYNGIDALIVAGVYGVIRVAQFFRYRFGRAARVREAMNRVMGAQSVYHGTK